ncbi:MAG: hypothetical protein RSB67_03150 [Clostridia bacterium]
MDANNILDNINTIAEKLYKSIEIEVYPILDKIVNIGPKILKEEPLKKIFFENRINGITVIANSLILLFLMYYICTQLLSIYNGNKADNILMFIVKIVIISIVINNSYYICSEILNIFELFSNAIDEVIFKSIGKEATFNELKEIIINIKDILNSDYISLEGIIKGILSFGSVTVLINFAIRYVTIIFLIIISPIGLACMASELTQEFSKTWFKLFISNLLIQIIVKIIIFIPLAFSKTSDIIYKVILVGAIYMIYRINNFAKEITSKFVSTKSKTNIFRG